MVSSAMPLQGAAPPRTATSMYAAVPATPTKNQAIEEEESEDEVDLDNEDIIREKPFTTYRH